MSNLSNTIKKSIGKGKHLFGSRRPTCTTSISLTGVTWCDFYQVLPNCDIIAFDSSVFSHDCQTRLFLHTLCLPALAARKVSGPYYYRLCKALYFVSVFLEYGNIVLGHAWCYFFQFGLIM